MQSQMGSLIICNGYKDAEFIKMALLGIKLGKKVIMVVEKLEELRTSSRSPNRSAWSRSLGFARGC